MHMGQTFHISQWCEHGSKKYKEALSKKLKAEGSAVSPYIKEGSSTYFHPPAARPEPKHLEGLTGLIFAYSARPQALQTVGCLLHSA